MHRVGSRLRATTLLLLVAVAPAVAETRADDERELRRIKEELWPRAYREG